MAYLAECASWGGFSGSPAFWKYPMVRQGTMHVQDRPIEFAEFGGISVLMGLVSGHCIINADAQLTRPCWIPASVELNAGIAVITPATAIAELLDREEFIEHRRHLAEAEAAKTGTFKREPSTRKGCLSLLPCTAPNTSRFAA